MELLPDSENHGGYFLFYLNILNCLHLSFVHLVPYILEISIIYFQRSTAPFMNGNLKHTQDAF